MDWKCSNFPHQRRRCLLSLLGLSTDGLSCADDFSLDNYIKNIEVELGKIYQLRIFAGTELVGVNFSIQGNTMTVVEVEGTVIKPYVVQNLDIMPGQRYSVIVTMDQEPANYWTSTVRL